MQMMGRRRYLEEFLLEPVRIRRGLSRREFFDQATEGLFKEKRRKVAERHKKYFGKEIL